MNMHVPEDAFNHEDAWVSHDLLNYQLSLGCYAYVEELLCLMTLIRWLPISKLYTSMSFDFSLLFYADAVWLGNCVEFICTSLESILSLQGLCIFLCGMSYSQMA